jgi:hypothetical protein
MQVTPRYDAFVFDGTNGSAVIAGLNAANLPEFDDWVIVSESSTELVIEGDVGGPERLEFTFAPGDAALFRSGVSQNSFQVLPAADFEAQYVEVA